MTKFLWGNSSSSMQTEGAWNLDGKGKSVYDVISAGPHRSDWKDGIDAYHRYQEDIDLMKEEGFNCYRFQISWSRVDPLGDGHFNPEGIAFYHKIVDALIKAGIEPYINLYHFDMPLKLAEKYNGFLSKQVVKAYCRYAYRMINEFKDQVHYWMTFNEQNFSFMDYDHSFGISGCLDKTPDINKVYQIGHNMMVAHAKVVNYIHRHTDNKVGGMVAYQEVYPYNCKPENVFVAKQINTFFNQNVINVFVDGRYLPSFWAYIKNHHISFNYTNSELNDIAKAKVDFIAFSYYQTETINVNNLDSKLYINDYLNKYQVKNPFLKRTDFDWEIDPVGFRNIISSLYNRYVVPIFPVENGIGQREELPNTPDRMIQDDYRIKYHKDHLSELTKAVKIDGAKVLGYLGWGLIDIPSSSGDVNKRYGTVFVNRTNYELKDMRRIPKKSFYWFQKMIKNDEFNLN